METPDRVVPTVPLAGCACGARCGASRVLAEGRHALHRLAQAVAVVVGTAELLPLQPAGSPRRALLEQELAAAITLLVERTEQLRDVLATTD
ncbi:MAG TPA: hypothetical protein VKZ60_01485 [Chloroflexota bacterium]|jgi:hypothetical protein|nr:hypothetical protein [Chloroflexota bacterium]